MIKGLRKIVDGNVFQGIILFVIVFNSVIMGIETIKDLPAGAVSALATINMVCLIIFIVEIIVKLLAYGLDYFKDPWNWFDVIIVGVSMASGLAFMSAFRAVRVLRVLKSLKASDHHRCDSEVHPEYRLDRSAAAPDLLHFRAYRSEFVRRGVPRLVRNDRQGDVHAVPGNDARELVHGHQQTGHGGVLLCVGVFRAVRAAVVFRCHERCRRYRRQRHRRG